MRSDLGLNPDNAEQIPGPLGKINVLALRGLQQVGFGLGASFPKFHRRMLSRLDAFRSKLLD